MSKSLGNFYTLRDVIARGYSGREVRYVLMAGHYRQSLNFSFDALDAARSALQRLDEFQDRLGTMAKAAPSGGELPDWAVNLKVKFEAGLADDLNASESLGALFDLVHAGNRAIDSKALTSEQAGSVLGLLAKLDGVLGFLAKPADEIPPQAVNLLELRQQARLSKNWAEADRVRNELAAMGWIIQDTPQGPKLKKK